MTNTIKLQKGNDVEIRIRPRKLNGRAYMAEELTDIVVKLVCQGETYLRTATIKDHKVCIQIDESMELGTYDILLHAKHAGRDIEDNRREAIALVEWSDHLNRSNYVQEFIEVCMPDPVTTSTTTDTDDEDEDEDADTTDTTGTTTEQ